MILIVAVIASILIAVLRGGRLARLADLKIRQAWLALAAVALQYPLVYNKLHEVLVAGVPLTRLVMLASYVLLLWVLWLNRRLPGIPLVGVGMLANLAVMMLNGGWMPITPEALGRLGHLDWAATGPVAKVWAAKNVMLSRGETRLWFLSDVFVLARPFPVPSAFSVGDVLIALGLFWLVQWALVGRGDRVVKPSNAPS